MYVKYLTYEKYQDTETIFNPTWTRIKKAILALNGHTSSYIILSPENEKGEEDIDEFLTIAGGGKNKLYLCKMRIEKARECDWEVYDPSQSSEELVEIVMVFANFYRRDECLSREIVLKVAETYATSGKRDHSVYWRSY